MADVVRIWSGDYGFMFDKRERLGMIAPIWIGGSADTGGWTSFDLDLSAQVDHEDLISRLEDIQPSLLLFLRKLHCIEVDTNGNARRLEKTLVDGITRIQLSRRDDHFPLVTKHYVLCSHAVPTHPQEEKRQGVTRSEIVLAFPITEAGEPVEEEQDIHAFLPLRSYGFFVSNLTTDSARTVLMAVTLVRHPSRFPHSLQSRGHLDRSVMESRAS